MKYKVKIDPKAKRDLDDLVKYIAVKDNLGDALKILEGLENSIYKLEEIPQRGHIPLELRETAIKRYLEIHYKPFRIIYEIESNLVYIHAVLDGRRNIQEILTERLLR